MLCMIKKMAKYRSYAFVIFGFVFVFLLGFFFFGKNSEQCICDLGLQGEDIPEIQPEKSASL